MASHLVSPVFETLRVILADLWVFPICLTLGLGVGAFHILWHGRKGFGSGIIVSTLAIGVLGIVLTRDPLSDLYNEDGLLTQGRNLGFSISQAAFNNGSITTGGGQAQLSTTGLIADATVRMPLQLMNFGTTIDDIGTCGDAYTAAMLTPTTATSPAPRTRWPPVGHHSILRPTPQWRQSRARSLLRPARSHLRLLRLLRHLQLRHGVLRSLRQRPAVHRGRRPDDPRPPRRRAARRITMFFKHAALVFAYTTYISMAAMIVLKMGARGGYADQVGMRHPLARLFMIAIVSAVAIGVFWWLKHELLGDHTSTTSPTPSPNSAVAAAKATSAAKAPTAAPATSTHVPRGPKPRQRRPR
ncbi:hypothetical protein MMRN_p0350 (plasmid) [Mycobacterium marinum]|nr:hypothetical protein MMRN_p0350 [Mycobacterium marinum]